MSDARRTPTVAIFKPDPEYIASNRNDSRTNCLENRDPFGDTVCGKDRPRTRNRSRGFSARGHKRCPVSSAAAVRAGAVDRRAIVRTELDGGPQ